MRRPPPRLVELVKRSEGFRAKPYLCPAGYWTIGYGFLCQADHPPMSREEADAELERVLPSYC